MENVTDLNTLQKRTFFAGNIIIAAVWILFVLALAAAAYLPARVFSSGLILGSYCSIMSLLWIYYLITGWGCAARERFGDKKLPQYIVLISGVLIFAALLYYAALLAVLPLILLPLILQKRFDLKSILLSLTAGIGEFAAVANTILLALLLQALLLGNWALTGNAALRCDIMLIVCGAVSLAGILSRGKLLANKQWQLKEVMRQRSFIIVWSLLLFSAAAAAAADRIQGNILEKTRAEAEKIFQYPLSEDGMKRFMQSDRPVDGTFYQDLARINHSISRRWRDNQLRKLSFRLGNHELSAEEKALLTKAFADSAGDYAALDKLLTRDPLPAYPSAEAPSANSSRVQIMLISGTVRTLNTRIKLDPDNALKHSQNIFKLIHLLDRRSLAGTFRQQGLIKSWVITIKNIQRNKLLSEAALNSIRQLARSEAETLEPASRLKSVIYPEAVSAWNMYQNYGRTTLSVTGAYFKYDRTEALRTLIRQYDNTDTPPPQRGIARMFAPPLRAAAEGLYKTQNLLLAL